MFSKQDIYSVTKNQKLFINDTSGQKTQIGNLISEFQVLQLSDVQLSNTEGERKFILQCQQRVRISNQYGNYLVADTKPNEYENYPVMVHASVELADLDKLKAEIIDYEPRTLSTNVQVSSSSGDTRGEAKSTSSSNTIGSSTSETHSFGVSISGSISSAFGKALGIDSSYGYSHTTSHERSHTEGTESSNNHSRENNQSASMSIKDWGSYALLNPDLGPSWTFGQEYPWNAIQYRKTTGTPNPKNSGQVKINLPWDMQTRLFDGETLTPPSHLSMYGVDFVMNCKWLVTIDKDNHDKINIRQSLKYLTASHSVDEGQSNLAVYRDQEPIIISIDELGNTTSFTTLEIDLMALDPIGLRHKTAVAGFLPHKFTNIPRRSESQSLSIPFSITSMTNDLMIQDITSYPQSPAIGAGFELKSNVLQAYFAPECSKLKMRLSFKITDSVHDYKLFMKHWKNEEKGIQLVFTINDYQENTLIKYIDEFESEGGEANLLSLSLRNNDFISSDYHDYLKLGLNTIDIEISPIGGQYQDKSSYSIRAISVERT